MKPAKKYSLFNSLLFTIILFSVSGNACAENIDPSNSNSQYAYGDNVGWHNAEPIVGSGIEVTNRKLTGYIWAENIGWINLNPSEYGGVINDSNGHLSGYAWGENVGWINFSPTHGGVLINPDTGVFSGHAWGENIGWISFASTHHSMTTSWQKFPWILFYPAFVTNNN